MNAGSALLQPCDVLKLDTEGAELDILSSYEPITRTTLVLLEAHGDKERAAIVKFMRDVARMKLIKADQTMAERWTMAFHNEESEA